MNIITSNQPSISRYAQRGIAAQPSAEQPVATPSDNVTFSSHRSPHTRKAITGVSVLGGAALGAYLIGSASGGLSGVTGTVVNTLTGVVGGAAAAGFAGAAIGAISSNDRDGWGGLAAAYAGLVVGGAVGAIGGGIAGAMLPGTVSSVLTYTAGAVAGGAAGVYIARGINN